jgi:hypothetical protein
MAKYKLTKPCFMNGSLYQEGDIVDFGGTPAPKGSIEVPSLVEKAKAAAAAPKADVEKEDAVLKGAAK